ncbi:hypothetical protein [Methylomicrobium sp. Wu6]|uniref:hypothetical protein n=1 Tax=Methylomicrobium sp. Wu6 TaxID=3107928 RepID=UPI002DD65DCB|nr:hypothetical protein [Methylomicrobium sp. Wu6]MEC4748394.1 hypothetical protein [Methylomicrobium sp. Wu6]
MKKKSIQAMRLCSLAAMMCGAGQMAYAHTGIKDKVFLEGMGNTGLSSATAFSSTVYNAFTITHGCLTNDVAEGTPAVHLNVIGQAAVFPNSTNSSDVRIFRYAAGSISGKTLVGTPVASPIGSAGGAIASPNDLSDDIQGAVAGQAFNNFGLGLVSPNLFGNVIIPKIDGTGITRGYAVYNGPTKYDSQVAPLEEDVISTTGLSTFKHTIPKFKSTSCAKSLVVRVAVGNWCLKGPKSDKNPDRMDAWVGSYTDSAIFNMTANPLIMPNSQATIDASPGTDFWPSFTVLRDTTNNPFQGACADPANQYDVVIEPKGTDIDKYLNIPKGKYPTGATGPAFWPQP